MIARSKVPIVKGIQRNEMKAANVHALDQVQRILEFIADDVAAGKPLTTYVAELSVEQAIRNQAKNVRAVIKSEHAPYVLPYKNKAMRGTGMETAAEKAYGLSRRDWR